MTDGHQWIDWAPINATWPAVDVWLADFPFDAAFLAEDAAWSPVFSARSFDGGRAQLDELWTTGGEVSWLGGPAVRPLPQWPHRTDGKPLAHVITIALYDLDGAAIEDQKRAWPEHREGLPTTGVLEVFHDGSLWMGVDGRSTR